MSGNERNQQRKEREVRDLLPFWAKELLTMKEKAEREYRDCEPSAKTCPER